jgi:hypothetical protein
MSKIIKEFIKNCNKIKFSTFIYLLSEFIFCIYKKKQLLHF